eukprot:TRINITY_DN36973_c0_g1_i1.p1 TRINITY_DN36973_c0_g1~~TRINITY_DN36973_c0_g1_i1.p1  ORF type:complete len:701 (+),score=112.36 TRINITY_DN36973_c0_g1_i1:29-2104(+)
MALQMHPKRRNWRWLASVSVLSAVLFAGWMLEGPGIEWTSTRTSAGQEEFEALGSISLFQRYDQITVDRLKLRWLWWPVLIYLFWGMAYICDDFFVRTIEVISERFEIPDDVAGATLMALGCNGPEMALNTISIFKQSNIGVGAVVGGEVFNVLVIIGTALLATPAKYMPLKVGLFSFSRDVLFYMVSVMMLYSVLQDGYVTLLDGLFLMLGAVAYTTVVILSAHLRKLFHDINRRATRKKLTRQITPEHLWEVHQSPIKKARSMRELMEHSQDPDYESDAEEELLDRWRASENCRQPEQGTVLKVRVEVRSRMMDKCNLAQERYIFLGESALMVSAAVNPLEKSSLHGHCSTGMVFEYSDNYLFVGGAWHHGGLVNDPTSLDATSASRLELPLLGRREQMPESAVELGVSETPWEIIPLDDILYCNTCALDDRMFVLHVHQHDDDSDLGRLITLEFIAKEPTVRAVWVDQLVNRLKARPRRQRPLAMPPARTCSTLLFEICQWFQKPVTVLAELSIPDMDNPDLQKWYPVAFMMSMTWLAVFAYLVVTACDGIHSDFGISNGVLGFTIAAAGTSFPNVFSGMVVSRQGKTTMAVSNALGANVQNVFLALALPWTIKCYLVGTFPLVVEGLTAQVVEIYVTLIPLLLVFVCYDHKLPKWSGWLLLCTYAIYVVIALGQEATGCEFWPFPCR